MSNKLFGSSYRVGDARPPVSFAKPATVVTEGNAIDLIDVYNTSELEMYQKDECVRAFVRDEARVQFDSIETEIVSLRKRLSSVAGKMKRQSALAADGTLSKALDDEMKDLTEAKRDLMAQIGCFDDKLHINRFDRFVMLRCFGVEDARLWYSWQDDMKDVDVQANSIGSVFSKEDKQKMDLITMHLHSVLKCYSDWIGNTIGEVNYIDVEIQEVALGIKGALGQHILGSLIYATAAERCKSKRCPTPVLRYIKPHCKLRVYPLSDAEARVMMRDGIIQQENRVYTGRAKNRKQRWSAIVSSSKGCSRIFVNKEAMVEHHRLRYIPSFESAIADFRAKLAHRKSDESSLPPSVMNDSSRTDIASDAKVKSAAVIVIDGDDEEGGEQSSKKQQQRVSKKKRRAETDLVTNATDADLVSSMPAKKKASKPRFRNGKPVFDKPKKRTAPDGDKSGNRWFSVGSKNVAADREVNKLEAVRRVNLILDHHKFEILGEAWKQRFRHRHDASQQRDMSDALLMCLYGLFKHWSSVDAAEDGHDLKPVRIWSIDYGEEKVGMTVLYQRSPDAPVIIEFWDNVSVFDVPPTYDEQYRWLCDKYQTLGSNNDTK